MNPAILVGDCQRALELAKKHGASQVEVFGQTSRAVTSSVEKNDLQISKSQQETRIGIRALVGNQLGFASTNDLTKIEQAAADAVTLAKASPGDPSNILPSAVDCPPVDGVYDPAADRFGTEEAVTQAIRFLEVAEALDPRLIIGNGEFSAEVRERVVLNSHGLEASERGSLFTYFVLATARDGERVSNFDFQFDASRDVASIDVEPITRRACEHALGSLGAEKGESFNGPILLSPSAVQQIFAPLAFQLSARNALRGMSRWKDAIGQSVGAEAVTMVDDGRLPGGVATAAFDREGIPHRRLTLIEGGVLRTFLHNAYTANAYGTASTGHASGSAGGLPGIGPTNLMILPGEVSKDDLISEIGQGLLVSRFSGNSDPVSGDFSGVAKAAHLIKDGKVVRPVTGTLIAGNVFEVLKTLSGVSIETERAFNAVLPYLRLEGISVTAE